MSRYFWPIFPPLPLSHFVTHPRTPRKYVTHLRPPRFLVGLIQKTRKKPLVQILSQLFVGLFVRGVLSGGLLSGRFCPESFSSIPPLLSEYICYNKKLNVTLNFMFHMYDKKFISVTPHALYPSPCHKLSHFLGPPPPRA